MPQMGKTWFQAQNDALLQLFECPTCKSVGFEVSVLGANRCTFCDGTFSGNPPTKQEIEDAQPKLVKQLKDRLHE